MVTLAGAELFTGNNLMTLAVLEKEDCRIRAPEKLGDRLHS